MILNILVIVVLILNSLILGSGLYYSWKVAKALPTLGAEITEAMGEIMEESNTIHTGIQSKLTSINRRLDKVDDNLSYYALSLAYPPIDNDDIPF